MDTGRSTASRKGDPRIVGIAKEVSESRDRKVPALLLQLKPILNEAAATSEEGIRMRQELWQYNLLKVAVLVLRQDYSVIPGEWGAAADLALLVSQATCGLACVTSEDRRQLEEDFLPRCVENMLLLSRHIHGILASLSASRERDKEASELCASFKKVLDALVHLASGYFYICPQVLTSQWLLQLLVSDTHKVTNITMATMEKLLRLDPQLLTRLNESTLHTLMDELVYKLTVNTDVMIAAGACRCLLRFCDHHKSLVELLCLRYRGLRPLLRRWEGRGFDRDLRHMAVLLESGSAIKAKAQRRDECARYIQAVWKGFRTRRRLVQANRAFAKFHKSYRLKKSRQEQVKLQTQYQTELHHQMKRRRQQLIRQFDEKRLHALEVLPASGIEEYLRKEKSVAALRIQTLWRGHRERSRVSERQKVKRQVKAAIIIQRGVRRWLERVEQARQEFPRHFKPDGLTEERKIELSGRIKQWREQNPSRMETPEEVAERHQRAQEMLARHYGNVRRYRKLEYQCHNLLARLDTDTELVSLAPSLGDITAADVDMYSSRSLPVATAAKQQHKLMMRRLQQPWWKTLGWEEEEEVDEDERERVVAEVLLETMGV
ncbi:IQ calmodulin-binding motif-containing protein 1 [Aplysia californica]|uniref:IQ calmodulin-binding motif-containing protein 1 n=1 Tax=Aplysia californica TaxID=6500 RepID=A0ABM1A638_APLCA|nr:IQ calmodulin-binding motif-containing protein 1 [Aplysia californica]